MMDIPSEIEFAKAIKISNDEDLEFVMDRYFSKEGLLPQIYKLATGEKSIKSSRILGQLMELRWILDEKIEEYRRTIL